MSFLLHKFISTVPDKWSLYSLSFSEVEQSSPMSFSNKDCEGFSWLCWKLNKQKMILKIHLRLPLAFQDILNNVNFTGKTPTEISSTWLCSQLQAKQVLVVILYLPFHLSLTFPIAFVYSIFFTTRKSSSRGI